MTKPSLFFLVLAGLFIINSCKKVGDGQNQTSNNNSKSQDTTSKKDTVISPAVSIAQSPLTVLLPNNCGQSFTITNSGPKGSLLNYSVADDGVLKGFLDFSPVTGSLLPGASDTIRVSVKPNLVNSTPSLVGSSLVLNVYTPKASNYTKIAVPVNIKSIAVITPLFIGTWSGTWTGVSTGRNNPGQAQPSTSVSGTWTLDLKTLDTVSMTATGSLTWNGTDAYWTYTSDNNGLITSASHHPFTPNRTIQFDAANATFHYSSTPGGCSESEIHLTIDGSFNQPNPSDGFYGPWFNANFNIDTKTVVTEGNGFLTHPYAPVTFDTGLSSGTVTGKKQ